MIMKFGVHKLPEPLKWFNPFVMIAHGFGSGLMRPASGTWGSLLAFLLLIIWFEPLTVPFRIIAIFGVYWVGIVSIKYIIHRSKSTINDPSWIVIDEWAGLMLASVLCASFTDFLIAFFIFRVIDIWKPWPISWVDKTVHGAHGIMIDDVLAGFITFVILGLLYYGDILPV